MELQRQSNQRLEELRNQAAQYRQTSERLASELFTESRNQWRRSLDGLLAFPKALALGVAGRTLRTSAMIERGIEVVGKSAEVLQSELGRAKQQLQRASQAGETGSEMGGGQTSAFGSGGSSYSGSAQQARVY